MLALQAIEPDRLIGPDQVGLGFLGQPEEIITKSAAGLFELAAGAQLLQGERADRFEHAEPQLAVGLCFAS